MAEYCLKKELVPADTFIKLYESFQKVKERQISADGYLKRFIPSKESKKETYYANYQ